MTNRDIKTSSQLTHQAQIVLNMAAARLALSARSYMRIIKVARTIADLGNAQAIDAEHIAESLQYRAQSTQSLELV